MIRKVHYASRKPKKHYPGLMCPTEEREQEFLFAWAESNYYRMPELAMMFAVPNGGYRHKATGAIMKRTGTKAGVPDVFLAVARGKYHGLFIEMKRQRGGSVSPSQRRWINDLNKQGYMAVVCRGGIEASKVVWAYLHDPETVALVGITEQEAKEIVEGAAKNADDKRG